LGGSLGGLAGSVLGAYFEYWFLYLLIRKSPRRWWLYYSLATVPALVFLVVVAPRVIRPDQGKFERMIDTATEQRVLALAARANVHARLLVDVHTIDGGRLNAYAAGTGDSKPIVFGQALVTRLDQAELVSIAGHEVGHHALHHVGRSIFVAWLCSALGWYAAYRIMPGLIARYHARFGFERISDIASLPLLLIVTGLMSLATGPVELAFSRYQEHEADRFALEITHSNHSFATGLIKIHEDEADPVDPRPGWLDQAWRETHPSLGERIDFSNTYKPWKTGASGRYGQLIDNPGTPR
jgi:Zn-dependent protease with chaperone function